MSEVKLRMSSDKTKHKILMAAGPIFAEKGMQHATIREICAAAEVNLASVNYYFTDKATLYLETVHFARASQNMKFPFPDWDSHTPAEYRLRGFVKTLLQRIVALREAPWQVRLLMNEVLQPTETCQVIVRDYFQPIFDRLLAIIDELTGEPLPNDLRIKLGFGVIAHCLFYRYSNSVASFMIAPDEQEYFNWDQLASYISEFCIAAIRHGNWSELAAGRT
ncbi:MAG TPA: CerR family C-terminal domain-containing protein [Pirellulaceae bacterium]|nr:CerR family C-terminal domain-containing protein [Pirellulaceae bacterium]HMO91052.1 CerR family C-terminal domain-containing protein [Pirellulaceae bacterium]HMP68167.1 CerR family C-terminal domain-containing protein [Pirellulaceae bacterium]